MPQSHGQQGGNNGACPDAATVLAVIEGEADEWLRNAYAQHLAQCSACLDLDRRLRNFDRPALTDESEWRYTEKRLDNWMNAFLNTTVAVPAAQAPEKGAERAGFWQSIWRPGAVWKISLATALLALVAVGVDVYLRLQPPVQPDQAKVTTSAPPAVAPATVPLPVENTQPKAEAPKISVPQTPAPAVPPSGASVSPHPMASAPQTPPQVKAQPKPEETVMAANKAVALEPRQPAASTPPRPPGHGSELRAKAAEQVTSAGEDARPAVANVATGRVFARDAQPPPAAANVPASLHLATGARLWLALESFNFQADGRVVFHGSLLLPLNSTGSSALDHGTEVSGFITSAQGQTSVLLSEIVIPGSHYKLRSEAGAGNARTAGSGGVVQFDSGKVLEMWVSSDSVYERATTESQ